MELVRYESTSSTKVRHQLTFGISLGLAVSGVGYDMISIFIVVYLWEVKAWLDFWTFNLGLGGVNSDMLKL